MLAALRASIDETLTYVALLPADFVARKGSYWRFGFGLIQPNFHITGHLDQIRAALAAVKK
jgi:hypothetical protein